MGRSLYRAFSPEMRITVLSKAALVSASCRLRSSVRDDNDYKNNTHKHTTTTTTTATTTTTTTTNDKHNNHNNHNNQQHTQFARATHWRVLSSQLSNVSYNTSGAAIC